MTDPRIDAIRERLAACTKCKGKGYVWPHCFDCGDSTYDHECPSQETCKACDGSGLDADLAYLLERLEQVSASEARACELLSDVTALAVSDWHREHPKFKTVTSEAVEFLRARGPRSDRVT